MAGIERICEYSGEDDGWKYKYKRNHIQILPKYRSVFKKKHAILIFFNTDEPNSFHYRCRSGYGSIYANFESNEFECIHGKWYQWVADRNHKDREIAKRISRARFHKYVLIVPTVPGKVEGEYVNWGYEKTSTIRRLKRLVGGEKYLTILNLNISYDDWYKNKSQL